MDHNTKIKLSLLFISMVVSIGMAETLLRGYYYYSFPGSVNDIYKVKPSQAPYFRLGDMIRPSRDAKIIYELKPNLDYPFSGTMVQTNARGWREKEIPMEKENNTIRIIGIGDSHMFGWGVAEEQRSMNVLKRILNENYPQKKWETMVFAVPGYNLAMEVEALKRYALAYHPDAIIYEFVGNDFCLPNFIVERKEIFSADSFIMYYIRKELLNKKEKEYTFVQFNEKGIPFESICNQESAPPPYDAIAGPESFFAALSELEHIGKERDIPVIFAFTISHILDDNGKQQIKGLMLNYSDISVVEFSDDVTSYLSKNNFSDFSSSDLALTKDDPHPSAKAHAMQAELLLKEMEKRGIIERMIQRG